MNHFDTKRNNASNRAHRVETVTQIVWYRQFWPWFLISLPLSAVIGGVVTIMIAFQNQDDIVISNYYKEGLMINESIKQLEVAEKNIRSINVSLDVHRRISIMIKLKALEVQSLDLPPKLTVAFQHPFDQERDKQFILPFSQITQQFESASLPLDAVRYRVTLTPEDNRWQMKFRWNPSVNANLSLLSDD